MAQNSAQDLADKNEGTHTSSLGTPILALLLIAFIRVYVPTVIMALVGYLGL